MSTVPRKQRLMRIKENPALEILLFMEKMEAKYESFTGTIPEKVKEAVQAQVDNLNIKIIERAVKDVLKDVKGPKGDPGDPGKPGMPAPKPVVGQDFYTKDDQAKIVDLVTKAAVDEIARENARLIEAGLRDIEVGTSAEAVREMINDSIGKYFATNDTVGEGNIEEMIAMAVGNLMDFEKVARGLEALAGEKRLDYKKLKNRPEERVKLYDDTKKDKRTIKRSGGSSSGASGSDAKAYDLSDQLDGSTKSFAVPANTRFIGLHGSQMPFTYRIGTDFTGTGTTTLTLTSEVDAPEAGQTLMLLYVE